MTPEEIARVVDGTGFMSPEKGVEMTRFIREKHLTSALELGFAHGVSTCYIAAAIQAEGGGSVVSIDLRGALRRTPNAEDLLVRCGCRDMVTLYHEPTSYTWRLMKMLEADPTPRFDLCFVDGAHSWETDGFAFFLADRLLVPGGWFIFDDLDWTYASSPTLGATERVRQMPEDERNTAQVRQVYELLVKANPGYGEFRVQGQWAYARKIANPAEVSRIRTETIYLPSLVDRVWSRLVSVARSRFPWLLSRR